MASFGSGGIAPFGAEGWRVAFVSVGAVSLGIGCLNLAFAKDPRVTGKAERAALPGQSEPEPELSLRELWAQIKGVVTVPTFLIIVLQVGLIWGWAGCSLGIGGCQ